MTTSAAIYAATYYNSGCSWKWECVQKVDKVICECLHQDIPLWVTYILIAMGILLIIYVLWALTRK